MAVTGQLNNHWYLYPQQTEVKNRLAWGLNIPGPVAQVLINRGIHTVEEGKQFLYPSLSRLHSPFSIKDIDRAVFIIQEYLKRGENIAIYGDYDVDGITATALLYDFLKQIGGNVSYYIPSRLVEGYGLNISALERLKSQGVSLIITVDCGISSYEEIAYAHELGMKVIVTDHHHPPERLPEAGAVINPLRPECTYPFKQLSGVGVAFKLVQALEEERGKTANIWDYLDLVALGTIADVCPLVGENRIMVTFGLKRAESELRPGLQALCNAAGLTRTALTTEDVAYIISPRINAAGRLGDADNALKLLMATSLEQAIPAAQYLHEENSRRQKLETDILNEATALAENIFLEEPERRFLLLAREGWHQGVLGIVASRMAEKYRLPVLLIALEEGNGRGSGRSSGGFNLIEALASCHSLLVGYGGHSSAVGMTVEEDFIPDLVNCLDQQARHYYENNAPEPDLYVDAVVEPDDIRPELVRALEKLEPYGNSNPRPFFVGNSWFLEHKREVGKGKNHLQLRINKNGQLFKGISFNGKSKLQQADLYREMNIIFSISFDRWLGNDAVQLELHQSVYNDEFAGCNFILVDRRGVKEKKRYIESLLQKDETVLLVVNTKQRQKRLESRFSKYQKLVISHQGDVPSHQESSVPVHLVLHDLPLRKEKLRRLLDFLYRHCREMDCLKIHLLYNAADFQENFKLFSATIPSLGSIEQVFHLLQEMADGKPVELHDAIRSLKKHLSFTPTSYLLERCLSILQKTTYICQDRDKHLCVKPAEQEEYCMLLKEVAATDSFHNEKERWKQFILWQRYLLETPGEQITKFLEG